MALDVMIDIETLSTKNDAAVVSIGAVKFNRDTGEISPDTFYNRIELQSAIKYGKVSGDTLRFWLKQPDEARLEITHTAKGGAILLPEALTLLHEWFPKSNCQVWANGPSFDCTILETMFVRCKVNTPWRFWHHRCVRTMKDIGETVGVAFPKESDGVLHNALDDAKRQAEFVCRVFKALDF